MFGILEAGGKNLAKRLQRDQRVIGKCAGFASANGVTVELAYCSVPPLLGRIANVGVDPARHTAFVGSRRALDGAFS
jgi:CHASE2 domain-containing sensor protein